MRITTTEDLFDEGFTAAMVPPPGRQGHRLR
jgi:hypothetical protein